jgi:hypothetical protein
MFIPKGKICPAFSSHKVIADYIPGTCIYFNTYAMSRDESIYKNSELFNPDRFLPASQGGDEEPFLQGPFGFGRRYMPTIPDYFLFFLSFPPHYGY